jgi:hypothetical protein
MEQSLKQAVQFKLKQQLELLEQPPELVKELERMSSLELFLVQELQFELKLLE